MKKAQKFFKVLIIGSLAILLAVSGTVLADSFIGSSFSISTDGTLEEVTPSVAYNSQQQEYLVVWSNDRPGNDDIRAQRLTRTGELIGGPFYISAGAGNERWYPDVTYDSTHNQYLVVWQNYDSTTGSSIRGRRVSNLGVVLDGSDITIRAGGAPTWNAYTPAVAYAFTSDRYLVVYEEVWGGSFGIYGQVITSAGALEGGQITIASSATEELQEPDVAYNVHANRYLVVWQQSATTEWDIYGHQVEGNGTLWGSTIVYAVSGMEEKYPAVAALPFAPSDIKFMVVYEYSASPTDQDIYGRLVKEDGTAIGASYLNIATYGADEIRPAIAGKSNDLEYFVTWRYEFSGSFAPIRGQSITYDGALTGQVAQAMPTNSDGNLPAVAAGPVGDFMVTWQDMQGTGSENIYGRFVGNRTYIPLVRRN